MPKPPKNKANNTAAPLLFWFLFIGVEGVLFLAGSGGGTALNGFGL